MNVFISLMFLVAPALIGAGMLFGVFKTRGDHENEKVNALVALLSYVPTLFIFLYLLLPKFGAVHSGTSDFINMLIGQGVPTYVISVTLIIASAVLFLLTIIYGLRVSRVWQLIASVVVAVGAMGMIYLYTRPGWTPLTYASQIGAVTGLVILIWFSVYWYSGLQDQFATMTSYFISNAVFVYAYYTIYGISCIDNLSLDSPLAKGWIIFNIIIIVFYLIWGKNEADWRSLLSYKALWVFMIVVMLLSFGWSVMSVVGIVNTKEAQIKATANLLRKKMLDLQLHEIQDNAIDSANSLNKLQQIVANPNATLSEVEKALAAVTNMANEADSLVYSSSGPNPVWNASTVDKWTGKVSSAFSNFKLPWGGDDDSIASASSLFKQDWMPPVTKKFSLVAGQIGNTSLHAGTRQPIRFHSNRNFLISVGDKPGGGYLWKEIPAGKVDFRFFKDGGAIILKAKRGGSSTTHITVAILENF